MNTKVLMAILVGTLLLIAVFVWVSLGELPDEEQPGNTPIIQQEPFHEEGEQKIWLNLLPIKNPSYYIEYIPHENKILGSIFPFDSQSLTEDDVVDIIKQEAIGRLTEIGVDLDKERVEWQIK